MSDEPGHKRCCTSKEGHIPHSTPDAQQDGRGNGTQSASKGNKRRSPMHPLGANQSEDYKKRKERPDASKRDKRHEHIATDSRKQNPSHISEANSSVDSQPGLSIAQQRLAALQERIKAKEKVGGSSSVMPFKGCKPTWPDSHWIGRMQSDGARHATSDIDRDHIERSAEHPTGVDHGQYEVIAPQVKLETEQLPRPPESECNDTQSVMAAPTGDCTSLSERASGKLK